MGGFKEESLWALAGSCRWVSHLASSMEDTGWPSRIWYFIGLAKKFILVFRYNVMERHWTHRLVLWADTCFSSSFATSPTLSSSGSSELPLHEDYGHVPLSLWTVADMPGIEGRLGCFWKDWKSFHSPETLVWGLKLGMRMHVVSKEKPFFRYVKNQE